MSDTHHTPKLPNFEVDIRLVKLNTGTSAKPCRECCDSKSCKEAQRSVEVRQ